MRKPALAVMVWLVFASGIAYVAAGDAKAVKGPALADAFTNLAPWQWDTSLPAPDQDLIENRLQPLCDDSFLAEFTNEGGGEYQLQVFYCNSRRPKNRLVYYLDSIQCLHGHYPSVSSETIGIGGRARATRLRLAKENSQSTVLYWLQSPGKTSPEYFRHAFRLYRQDLLCRRSDGCFIKLAYYGARDRERDESLLALARAVHAALDKWFSRCQGE